MKNYSDRKRDEDMLKAGYDDYEDFRYDEAQAAADELVKNSPEFSGGWDLLGLCYKNLAEENSVKKGPEALAETRAIFDKAVEAFKKALALESAREQSWINLGRVYDAYILTNYDEETEGFTSEKIDGVKAQECYMKALELNRCEENYLSALEGEWSKEQRSILEDWCIHDTFNPLPLTLLSRHYYEEEDTVNSEKYIKKSLALKETGEAFFHLCDLYLDTNRLDECEKLVNKIDPKKRPDLYGDDGDHGQMDRNEYHALKSYLKQELAKTRKIKVPKIKIKSIKRTKLQEALEADFEKKAAGLKEINSDLLKIITVKPKEILSELSKLDENEILAYFKEGLESSLEFLDPVESYKALYFTWRYSDMETIGFGVKKYHLEDRENPFQTLKEPKYNSDEENNGFGTVAIVLDAWVPGKNEYDDDDDDGDNGDDENKGLCDIYQENEQAIPLNLRSEYKALGDLYDSLFTAKLNQLVSLAYGLITAPKPGYLLCGIRYKPESIVLLAAP
ncbi:hypothetical protein [Leadbettera azotonutricia]|uniref:Uncharacterized protein n=1 Tax=Leadbettera azotonutricia (strain ATCC BAA-888 / DSM 13862 / ZAS-9) TaxID=545695 RepID=F5Y9N2_LEAAZ|nr:hypothetical protein [Leadbettera azotonutricia]AEF80858.1 hypothetical protein TREAZ_0799 [Leadbettera azotonutricia ZAS-9]